MTSRAPLNGSNGQPPQANGASNARADGRLVLGMAPWDALRYAAVDVTTAVQIARRRHDLGPLAAVALGRTMAAAALLLRFTTKNPGSIRVEIQGDGPLGQVVAEFDAEGALVGHVANPHVAIGDLGEGSADGFAIGAAVGEGMMRVTRTSARGQYTSQVALVDGEIGTDLAHFLEQSEQIRSAALVGVLPRSVGIAAAGGMLVEAMPGVEDIAVTGLERNLRALGGRVSSVLEAGGIDALTQRVLDGFQLETLETHALRFACRCDREMLRLRVTQALAAEASTDDLFDADERCEVVCQRCAERFVFTRAELMHDAADAAPS